MRPAHPAGFHQKIAPLLLARSRRIFSGSVLKMLKTFRDTLPPRIARIALALLVFSNAPCSAGVEWEILKSLNTDSRPLDVAVSADGKSVFVLTENGTVFIFGADGTLVDRMSVGPQAGRIAADPEGERLYVTNRQSNRVEVVQIDTLREIRLSGAPFKGREKAPVVIAVFSDFQ
jgi:DNA-binding beta-propeller fold protein YncE